MRSRPRRDRPLVLLAVTAALLVPAQSQAVGRGTGWVTHGPWGGLVPAMVADPTHPGVVFAGADTGGIFRSTDGGATWLHVGLTSPENDAAVTGLAMSPATPDVVYAATGRGVFRSENDGDHWDKVASEHYLALQSSFVADPVTPGLLYAGSGGAVERSVDGGVTWEVVAGEPYCDYDPCDFIGAIAVDPMRPSVVYAGGDYELLKSTDSGAHWRSLPFHDDMQSLLVVPGEPSTLFAAGYDSLWRSEHGGRHWTAIGPARLRPGVLAANEDGSELFMAGAARWPGDTIRVVASRDLGDSWFDLSGGLGVWPIQTLVVLHGAGTLVAGTYGGIYRRPTGGAWRSASHGYVGLTPGVLEVAGDTVLAGTWGEGVFRRSSAGWRPMNSGIDSEAFDYGRFVSRLVAAPGDPSVLYAGELNAGLYRSVDGGSHWSLVKPGPMIASIDIAVHPRDPEHLFAAMDGGGLAESRDGGRTWRPKRDGLPARGEGYVDGAPAIDPTHPLRMYVGTNRGVFVTADGGNTWTPSSTGIPASAGDLRVVLDPSSRSTVYAVADAGLFRSTDRARHWTFLEGSPERVVGLAFGDHGELFTASYRPRGVEASTDGGATWHLVNGGLSGQPVRDVAVANGTLYAAARSGVFEVAVHD